MNSSPISHTKTDFHLGGWILGMQCLPRQLALSDFHVVVALWCLTMKFQTTNGVGVVKGNQDAASECYVVELRESKQWEKGKGAEVAFCIKNSIA